jgi:lysine 2,3-aminomutase
VWNDWNWQLKNRINTIAGLRDVWATDAISARAAAEAARRFRMGVTPHFLNTIRTAGPADRDALARIVTPRKEELIIADPDMADPLHEEQDSPVHGLVHRYPDRVLLMATQFCASYCRFCTRKRLVGKENGIGTVRSLEAAFRYIRSNSRIRDVVVSGGDPLILPDDRLEFILGSLRRIPHVEIIRLGTKAPVYLPQRITDDFLAMVRKHHPVWMSVHVSHPAELVPETAAALERIADAGIPMGSQTVLLRGVNDCPAVMKRLMTGLMRHRVKPYYMYQCDLSMGLEHFRTPVTRGIEILEHLRGHISGYAVPTFVVDAPGGGGKIPVQPQYMLSQGAGVTVLRNFEGNITRYREPVGYQTPCARCGQPCDSSCGVAGLLAGNGSETGADRDTARAPANISHPR